MNIITLLESISLDKSRIGSFSTQDFAQLKIQLVAQKDIDPEIQDSDIDQLLKALKNEPESLQVVLNDRLLFNFFAKKSHPRKDFTDQFAYVEAEKVKSFIQLFLMEELNVFFSQNLEANTFEEIAVVAQAKNYFPDSLNFMLKQHSLDKLDDAIDALKPPYGNFSKILYIKDANFFALLNNIKDLEVEAKVEDFFHAISNFYKQNNSSELANKTFSAMDKYSPIDNAFSERIKKYKNIASHNYGAHIPKKKNLTWVYVVVGLFVFIRIVVFFSMTNFNGFEDNQVTYDDETEYKPEPRKLDRYYTDMKYSIDSFQVFLTAYKESEIKKITQESSLKTGENPFETFYQNPPTADSNHFITVTNQTGYDMVLLENTVLYDSIKMPRSAHYIKAGDALEINFNTSYTETIFNMYIGKKWATFQTLTNKNLFIRNHSVVEYRFSQLIPKSNEILKTDYNFINDAVISYSNGGLNIDSEGARINPLHLSKD
jgi:hypothetical protein